MNAVTLLRHSLTAANEARLYCGSTDLPLSAAGKALAESMKCAFSYADHGLFLDTGMLRTAQTLDILSGHSADFSLSALREMDFGAFEMHSYEQLKHDEDYRRWIMDESGDVCCPGGESRNGFRRRVLRAGQKLLCRPEDDALVICHGGTIVQLMQNWFPNAARGFYDWQPTPCHGYRILLQNGIPISYSGL